MSITFFLIASLAPVVLDFYLFCVYVHIPECMYMQSMYEECWRSEQGIGSLGIGVRGDCEPLCGLWQLNLGFLQEQ